MSLYKYDKKFYADLSAVTAFQRDHLEKVHRLTIILDYINSHPGLKGVLALKGGTAINLTIFNLSRLSIDIDLDFCSDVTREEMLLKRGNINAILMKYFETEGYSIKSDSKNHFSLDSWVIGYYNTSGNPDKIKIEINYTLRQHILPVEKRSISTDIFNMEHKILRLSKVELFASKIAALLNRTAARDLYNIYNIVKYGLVEKEEYTLLRKCVVFYKLISSEDRAANFDTSIIDKLTKRKLIRIFYRF